MHFVQFSKEYKIDFDFCSAEFFCKMVRLSLRIDYCGFGPFSSTSTALMISISLLKVHVCIINKEED